jgi:Flp pilus assembly protein CpaB
VRKLPAEAVQSDAVTSSAQLGGAVVLQPIFRGEQVTMRRLGAANEQGVRTALKGAFRAIAVPGDARQLLAGTLRDGDHVDLLVNVHQQAAKTRIALRDLVVLQAPPATSTTSTDLTALIRLTDTQAQVLFWALKNGDWSFVLRPATKATTTATAPTGEAAVLKGQ